MNEKLKLYIVVAVTAVAVIILGVAVWYRAGHPAKPAGGGATATAQPRFAAQAITVAQFPAGFPANLPIEKNATTTAVQRITDAVSGQQQFDETYFTKLTIAANFAAYQAYFGAKPWKLIQTQTVDQPTYKSLMAVNGTAVARVVINYKVAAAHAVTISYITQPAAAPAAGK